MSTNNLALIVVDAFAHSVDEEKDIAIPEISALVNSGVASRVFEYAVNLSGINHSGRVTQRLYSVDLDISDSLSETVPGELIFVGGSLGNNHYRAFTKLLERMATQTAPSILHLPFNAAYTFTQEYDSGEGWTAGKLASKNDDVFANYRSTLAQYCKDSVMIECGESRPTVAPLVTVRLYDRWQDIKPANK